MVTGHGAEAVAAAARAIDPDVRIVHQAERRGTGHAVHAGGAGARGLRRRRGGALRRHALHPAGDAARPCSTERARGAGVVVLGFEAADPRDYGRLVVGADGGLEAIVEARRAGRAPSRRCALQLRA